MKNQKTKGENMSKLRLTPEDHLRGKVIPPGWYPVEVVNVEEKPAKSDGSTNWSIECKVIDGELKGVVLYTNFNEKAPGFAKNFIVASGGKLNPKETVEYDLSRSIGQKMQAYVTNELYNNNMTNKLTDFKPL